MYILQDAFNSILDYEKDTAFFAVYDGHGGHEVAEYLSRNMPQFLKDFELFQEGDIEKALTESFLKMDASLITTEVMAILKQIAMEGVDPDVDENIDALYEEASMPVEQVIEKYKDGDGQSELKLRDDGPSKSSGSKEAGSSKERTRSGRSTNNSLKASEEESQKESKDQSAECIEKILNPTEKADDLKENAIAVRVETEEVTDEPKEEKQESLKMSDLSEVQDKLVEGILVMNN